MDYPQRYEGLADIFVGSQFNAYMIPEAIWSSLHKFVMDMQAIDGTRKTVTLTSLDGQWFTNEEGIKVVLWHDEDDELIVSGAWAADGKKSVLIGRLRKSE